MFNFKKLAACIMTVSCLAATVTSISANAATYDGSKAASYAVSHAKSYNSDYFKHAQDCTNFVSQCAYAGGMPMYSSLASWGVAALKSGCASGRDDEWFYYHKKNDNNESWSSTWSIVDKDGTKDGLRRYIKKNSKNTYSKTNFKYNSSTFYQYVKAGDIVQLSSDGGDSYYHSIVISSVSGSTVYYCCHTTDRKSENLKNHIDSNTTVSVYRPKA